MDMGLAGQVVLVTGAAGGIGWRCCELLIEEGVRVVGADARALDREAAARLENSGGFAVQQDVTDAAAWSQVMGGIHQRCGRIDGLVNNAGVIRMRNLERLSLEDWRNETSVNLDGVFLGTQAGILAMKEKGGSIVNVASIAALVGIHTAPAYSAAKGGVGAFTRSAAMHCAHYGYNIRINAIFPGYTDTPMVDALLQGAKDPERMRQTLAGQVPLGRLATVTDIARGVLYLLGSSGGFVTAADLVIDGGYVAR
ncbi:MAG: SDR family oxidoreductase [Dehalococcoidia bacterium]